MTIILKIPDLVDDSLKGINQQISTLQTKVNAITNDLNAVKSHGGAISTSTASMPAIAPPPGGPPSGPPPPPGGPPGGPPAGPGGPPPGPRAAANPQTLRGAIMGELKSLFAKRKQT